MKTTFNLGAVLNEVRDMHASFDAHVHPRPVLVRAFAREQERLFGLCQEEDPAWAVTTSDEIAIEPPFTEPIPFRSGGIIEIRAAPKTAPEGLYRVDLVAFGARSEPFYRFSAYTRHDAIVLCAGAWDQVRGIVIDHIPPVVAPTDDEHKFTLPDESRPALVYRVALFLAARNPAAITVPPASIALWAKLAEQAEMRMQARAGESGLVRVATRLDGQPG